MERVSALERLKEEYITETELAEFLNVDTKRIRDLRSHHITGKYEFIGHIKPTSKCILYKYADVIKWLNSFDSHSFGIGKALENLNEKDE